MEFFRAKVVRKSNVKETFVTQFNGSQEETIKHAMEKAIDLAAINQGDRLYVLTMNCYEFPQAWSIHSSSIAGTDLKVTTKIF